MYETPQLENSSGAINVWSSTPYSNGWAEEGVEGSAYAWFKYKMNEKLVSCANRVSHQGSLGYHFAPDGCRFQGLQA